MKKILAIANQKGGVGKSTTTINLGAALALKGKTVLIIDIDPQGNTTSGLGIEKEKSKSIIYDVIEGKVDCKEAIIKTNYDNLYIIPSDVDLAGAEVELVNVPGREYKLKSALEPVREDYDYILIDCPPSLGLLTVNALATADGVIIPIQCEYFALEGVAQLLTTIKIVQKHINKKLDISGVLLTMYDGRTNLSVQVAEQIKKYFADKVYKTTIPRNIRLSEAPSYGMPIQYYSPRSKGAEAYNDLAKEILERDVNSE